MNELLLVVTSNLKKEEDMKRLAKSVDVSENICVYFINQNEDKLLNQVYKFTKCKVIEFRTKKIVPLSVARNIALKTIYNEEHDLNRTVIMFPDDDAWFDKKTIDYLLSEKIKGLCLRTIDPDLKKSFNGLSYTEGEVKGWHLIHDICSICLVVPYENLVTLKLLFNENLGVGNRISQGEESLFIYHLHENGLRIYYNPHYIYHPYKLTSNIQNYYSLSYFWAWGLTHLSKIFAWPCIKYLAKYTVALGLTFKSTRYPKIFKAVWKGVFDGIRNTEKIVGE